MGYRNCSELNEAGNPPRGGIVWSDRLIRKRMRSDAALKTSPLAGVLAFYFELPRAPYRLFRVSRPTLQRCVRFATEFPDQVQRSV